MLPKVRGVALTKGVTFTVALLNQAGVLSSGQIGASKPIQTSNLLVSVVNFHSGTINSAQTNRNRSLLWLGLAMCVGDAWR